jgi:putative methyltransferase (TIGR04325 family)
LQYLSDPDATIAALRRCKSRYIVIDRTPVWDGPSHWVTVQHVPARIYRASYACRIFSTALLRCAFTEDYEPIAEFRASDGSARAGGRMFHFVGMVLRKR